MIKIKKNGFKSESAYNFSTPLLLNDEKIKIMTDLKNNYNPSNNYNESLFFDIANLSDNNIKKIKELYNKYTIPINESYSVIFNYKPNIDKKIDNLIKLKNANVSDSLLAEITNKLTDEKIDLMIKIKNNKTHSELDDFELYNRIHLNIIKD